MLVLIGMPGSGKSTLGKILASKLHLPFFDTDDLIKKELGYSISEFFKIHGEAAFRDKEQAIIACVTKRAPCVLATGGGAVLREANRKALQDAGCVLYLRAQAPCLFKRLKNDRNRPLLQNTEPLKAIQNLLQERSPIYTSCANVIIDIDIHPLKALASVTLTQLKLSNCMHLVTEQKTPAIIVSKKEESPKKHRS